ncbi:MAG: branched-chain amino acid ABC transporter permease [Burkholderiaceae bacterium]|nr:branched-chain amino acid ABC transporter permease [Burkholderiaceae bacterium]
MNASTEILAKPLADARRLSNARILWAVVGLVCCLLLPFVFSGYQLFQVTLTLIMAIAVLGLNLLVGYNGQLSLGHGAFFALGAYTAAILMDKFGVPYWMAIPAAGAVSLFVGFLFGLPALRLEGLYLALATFALAVATPQLIRYKAIEKWTGGYQGIVLQKPSAPAWSGMDDDRWLYYFVVIIAAILFFVAWNLTRSNVGRTMVAIQDHPMAAAAMGVNVAFYKSATFAVSTMYTGIAGALGAIAVQFASPDSYGLFLSISLLVGVVVGGLGTISGAIFGAAVIQFVPNIADQVSKAAPWAIYGLFLIGCMYLMPTGAVGLIQGIARRVRRAFQRS